MASVLRYCCFRLILSENTEIFSILWVKCSAFVADIIQLVMTDLSRLIKCDPGITVKGEGWWYAITCQCCFTDTEHASWVLEACPQDQIYEKENLRTPNVRCLKILCRRAQKHHSNLISDTLQTCFTFVLWIVVSHIKLPPNMKLVAVTKISCDQDFRLELDILLYFR